MNSSLFSMHKHHGRYNSTERANSELPLFIGFFVDCGRHPAGSCRLAATTFRLSGDEIQTPAA
jgi:hypothetical protein